MIALALIRHSLRRSQALLFSVSGVLFGFQLLLAAVARSLQRSGAFQQLAAFVPDFIRVLMGPSLVGMLSLSGVIGVGYFHVAVMGTLVGWAVAVATEPAQEVESGFADLVLSRPVLRTAIITRSVVLLVATVVFLIGMMLVGTLAGLRWIVGDDQAAPAPRLVLWLAVNLAALVFCCGGCTLAIGAGARRRSVAGSLAAVVLLALFLLDYVGRVWKAADPLARLSPFRYFNPLEILLSGKLPLAQVALLVGAGAVGCAVAYVVFAKRDL